jgi:hypothetical protein
MSDLFAENGLVLNRYHRRVVVFVRRALIAHQRHLDRAPDLDFTKFCASLMRLERRRYRAARAAVCLDVPPGRAAHWFDRIVRAARKMYHALERGTDGLGDAMRALNAALEPVNSLRMATPAGDRPQGRHARAPKSPAGDGALWSRTVTLTQLAKYYGQDRRTVRQWLTKKKVRHRQLSRCSLQVDLRSVPEHVRRRLHAC